MSSYEDQLAQMEEWAATARASAPTAEQQSPEWLAERVGHCTASRFCDVLEITKKGTESAKRRNYRVELIVERLTGEPAPHYVTAAMQHGIDTEPYAGMAYEGRTGAIVEHVGFIHHPELKWVGGSPDGLIGLDGGVEFKCPLPAEHVRILLTNDITDYLPQAAGLMWVTGREWWDVCSYCPMMPDGLQLYVQRVHRDDAYIAKLSDAVQTFLEEVAEQCAALKQLRAAA